MNATLDTGDVYLSLSLTTRPPMRRVCSETHRVRDTSSSRWRNNHYSENIMLHSGSTLGVGTPSGWRDAKEKEEEHTRSLALATQSRLKEYRGRSEARSRNTIFTSIPCPPSTFTVNTLKSTCNLIAAYFNESVVKAIGAIMTDLNNASRKSRIST